MDYTLRRQPDGTVNAEPGDAVECCLRETWFPGVFIGMKDDAVIISGEDLLADRCYFPPRLVRHARGGAGWHRLREARLRDEVKEVIAYIQSFLAEKPTLDGRSEFVARALGTRLIAALADLDNVEPTT